MTTTNTTNTTATARTGWAALLLTFVMALVASIGVGGKPADAAPAHIPASAPASAVPAVGGPAHALPASSPIHSVVLPRYSAGDCFAGITALGGGIAGKSAWGVAGAIVSLFQCGRWLGTYTVDGFCWSTRQWWGWNARSAMWAASWGRYTRC